MRIYGLALLSTITLAACETEPSPAPIEPFSLARVATEGMRVGYHASPSILVQTAAIPGNCEFGSSGLSYKGELPPGIEFHAWDALNGGGHNPFTGTPRQAGTWNGILETGFQCNSGGPLYKRNIPVTFNVAP